MERWKSAPYATTPGKAIALALGIYIVDYVMQKLNTRIARTELYCRDNPKTTKL